MRYWFTMLLSVLMTLVLLSVLVVLVAACISPTPTASPLPTPTTSPLPTPTYPPSPPPTLTPTETPIPTPAPPDDVRGVRMQASSCPDPATCAARLDCLEAAGANALYYPIYYGEAYYHSQLMPSRPFDSLAYLVPEAHARGMEVYPLITAAHIGWPEHPEWNARNSLGTPEDWLDFSQPVARQFLADVADELVSGYDVDGVLLDYIRWDNRWKNVPSGEHITAAVVEIGASVASRVPLAAATFDYPPTAEQAGQNWVEWLDAYAVDYVTPMTYRPDSILAVILQYWQNEGLFPSPRLIPRLAVVWFDPVIPKTTGQVLGQIQMVRDAGTTGVSLWDDRYICDNPDLVEALAAGGWYGELPTPTPTPTPVPPTPTPTQSSPLPTPTPTQSSPLPTPTPQPGEKLVGIFDYPPATGWPSISLSRLSVPYLEQARQAGVHVLVTLTGGHGNYSTNGNFDLVKWKAALDNNDLAAVQGYAGNTIVGLYAIDEPHDFGAGDGPTYAELDAACEYAHQQLPGILCGYNTPPAWLLPGAPYNDIDFVFTQSNFQRTSTPAQWTAWAAQQFADAASCGIGPVYLSINAATGSPSAAQIQGAGEALCQFPVQGVMAWKWAYVSGMESAFDSIAVACAGGRQPKPLPPFVPPWLKFNLSGGVLMEVLTVALFLVVVANRLVEALIVPVFDKFKLDKFAVQYIAWLVGGLLVWLSGVNLFIAYLPDPLAGQILTAVLSGGGATLLHDIFDKNVITAQ